jgi:hypothetical protein
LYTIMQTIPQTGIPNNIVSDLMLSLVPICG